MLERVCQGKVANFWMEEPLQLLRGETSCADFQLWWMFWDIPVRVGGGFPSPAPLAKNATKASPQPQLSRRTFLLFGTYGLTGEIHRRLQLRSVPEKAPI